jgi:type VI protein secretion system component Hcp
MSGFSHRRNAVLVMSCVALALAVARDASPQDQPKGMFMQIPGINGGVGPCGEKPSNLGWIAIATLQLGSQTIAANGWWYITPPPGVQTITLTKQADSASAGLSAAFASKQTFSTVTIRLCSVKVNGTDAPAKGYILQNAVLSSFTASAGSEKLVLSFKGLSMKAFIQPAATPAPPTKVLAAPSSKRRVFRAIPTATPKA